VSGPATTTMNAAPAVNTATAAAGLGGGDGLPVSPFVGLDVCAHAGLRVQPGGRTVMFTDQVWRFVDVADLPVQMWQSATCLDFTAVSNPGWRLVAKEYLFALLAPRHEQVAVLPHAYRTARTLWTCSERLAETARWLNWLTTQQVTALGQVTQDHCDRYLADRTARRDGTGTRIGTLGPSVVRKAAAVVIELGLYGELFTADAYRPGFIPWNGRTSSRVAGMSRPAGNTTPVLQARLLAPMLSAALYLTTVLAPHVVDLARLERTRRDREAVLPQVRVRLGDLAEVLDRHDRDASPLPAVQEQHVQARLNRGWDPDDPLLRVGLRALALQTGSSALPAEVITQARPLITATAGRVGIAKPLARNAPHVPHATGPDTLAWTLPLHEHQARDLIVYLNTAALLVTATVTGMRAGELMELRTGCRHTTSHGPGLVRHHLTGTITKHRPPGGTPDEWVVIEQVDHAVAVAEQLALIADRDLIFGRFYFNKRYDRFRAWVNSPAGQRLGLTPIPDGDLTMRMLRRTLAHELAYRPGGLLAAKIALKHVSVATTEGYANRPGGAQARLLAEIQDHEHERNLGLLLAEYASYQDGVMPSGPGAAELIQFFGTIDGISTNHTPNVVAADQQILNLLTKRAGTLHLNATNYCWFADPSRALCLKLAETQAPATPLAGMCDSARCPQATHHPHHRPIWADAVTQTTTFLGTLGRTRTTERARLNTELDRARRILHAIDAAALPAAAHDDTDLTGQEQPPCA
jgi:integrase